MSTVPPSPANPPTGAPCAPIASSPDRRPEIDAPVASNALSRNGTVTHVRGNAPDITAQQHAGTVMIAPGPTPFRTYRIARVAAHPGHPTWPESMYSSAGIVRRAMSGPLLRAVEVGPRDLVPVPVARQQCVEHPFDHGRREVPPPPPAPPPAARPGGPGPRRGRSRSSGPARRAGP